MIDNFIRRFRGDAESVFTCGCCYWFSYILSERFWQDGAFIVYDPVQNHFACRIGYGVYDITGDVTDKGKWMPWDTYPDAVEKERIINDCVNF